MRDDLSKEIKDILDKNPEFKKLFENLDQQITEAIPLVAEARALLTAGFEQCHDPIQLLSSMSIFKAVMLDMYQKDTGKTLEETHGRFAELIDKPFCAIAIDFTRDWLIKNRDLMKKFVTIEDNNAQEEPN